MHEKSGLELQKNLKYKWLRQKVSRMRVGVRTATLLRISRKKMRFEDIRNDE